MTKSFSDEKPSLPSHNEPTRQGSIIRFESTSSSRQPSPPPDHGRKCSELLEKPGGPEWRSGSGSETPSIVEETEVSRAHIAGHRFTVASLMCIDHWQKGLTVMGCFFLMFNSWGLVNAYGTYQSYYKQHLLKHESMAMLNLIGATQSCFVLLLSLLVGRILDAGHFYRLTIVGGILVTLGSFLLSLRAVTDHFIYVWLTQGLVMSLGMACMFVPSSQIVASWFTTWKTVFMGIVACGASIAGLIYPLMLKHLILQYGFHTSQRYVAILTAITCVLAAAFAVPNPDRVIRPPKTWFKSSTFFDPDCFRNRSSLGLIIGIGLLFTGFYAVFFNLEDWAADSGFGTRDTPITENVGLSNEVPNDAIRTFWLLCIMNASSTFGRIGFTLLGDFVGALRTHAGVTFTAAIFLFAIWTTINGSTYCLVFVILYGILSGADIALPPGSMANVLGDDPHERAKLGQWVGSMYMCAAPFALAGPVLGGLLIGVGNLAYLPLQLWCGAALFLSAVAMVWASFAYSPTFLRWSGQSKGEV